jgi:hypothetical protein
VFDEPEIAAMFDPDMPSAPLTAARHAERRLLSVGEMWVIA